MKNYTLLFILLFLANMVSAQCPVIFNFDTVYCQNETPVILPTSSGTITGSWSPATISTSAAGTFTFVFTPDDVNVCSVNTVVVVRVDANPTATITGTNTICSGASTTFTASGGTSFAWSNSASTAATTVSTAGTYTVTVTDGNGCTATGSRILTVNANPTAAIIGTNTICSGANTTFTASGGTSYTWSNSSTTVATTVSTAGTYTVTVTDGNGCTATGSRTLTVNANPTAAITGTNTICSGASTTFTASGGTSYAWSNSASTAATTVSTAGTYTVTVTDGNGCTATSNRTLTVNANPTASPSFAQNAICAGTSTLLNANANAGSGNISSFAWSSGISGSIASGNVSVAGTYTVTVTNSNGCTVVASSAPLTVNPTPTISPIANQSFCAGASSAPVTIWSAVTGSNYTWTNSNTAIGLPGAGTSVVNAFSGINNGTTPSTANIIVISEAANCIARDTFTITVNPNPIVNAGSDDTICSGQPLALSATGALAYNWTSNVVNNQIFYPQVSNVYQVTGYNQYNCAATDFVSVTVNASPVLDLGPDLSVCSGDSLSFSTQNSGTQWSGLATATGITLNINPISSGNLIAQITNGNGSCPTRDTVFITVRPRPNVSAGNDQNICSGQSVILSASGALNYSWSGGVNNNQPFVPLSSASYTVTGYNQFNCSATDVVTVSVTASPQLNLGADVEICLGDSIRFDANANATWTGLADSTGNLVNIRPTSSGNLIAQLANGSCIARDTVFITVRPRPNVSAGNDQNICSGQSVILSATGALNYIWSGGVNNNQAFFPGSSSVYTVTGYNQFNCSATDSVNVNVTPSPQLNFGANVEICFGDSIRIDANANAQWSGILTDTAQVISFVPAQSGYLSCEVSNNGCSIKDSIFVQVNPIPYPFISGLDEVCANSSWQRYAVAPGTNAYNWTISNGEILAGNGTNEIFVHWFDSVGGRLTVNEYIWSSGCSSEEELNVSFIDTALAPAEIRLLYNGGNILHTTLDYPQMSWGYESVQTHIPVYLGVYTQYCQIQNFDPSNFNYWVEIGDGNGCITKSYYNAPTFPIAVSNIDSEISAKVYPNPANDLIYIELERMNSEVNFQLSDISGKVIQSGLLQKTVNTISLERLPSAMYFVRIGNENNSSIYKIVKL